MSRIGLPSSLHHRYVTIGASGLRAGSESLARSFGKLSVPEVYPTFTGFKSLGGASDAQGHAAGLVGCS